MLTLVEELCTAVCITEPTDVVPHQLVYHSIPRKYEIGPTVKATTINIYSIPIAMKNGIILCNIIHHVALNFLGGCQVLAKTLQHWQ